MSDEIAATAAEAPPAPAGEEAKEEHSLGTRTIRSMFWVYGSYVGGRIMVLLSIAILARLLTPKDFGLVALALTFTALLETVKDFGLGQALIVSKEEDIESRANTVFWWGMIIGLTGTLIICVSAHWIADFYNNQQVFWVLIALSLNFPLTALGATQEAIAQKRMDFRWQTAAQLSNVAVRGTLGVALALLGFGVWSLVLGYLVGTLTWSVVLWVLVGFRPKLKFTNQHARELFAFGGILTAVDVLHGIWASADALVIGRVLGASSLGLYSLGIRLPELIIINLSVVAASVLFPAFTKVDDDRLKRVLLTSLRFTMVIGAPLAAGLAVLSPAIVPALFGGQWGGAVAPMQIICLYALLLTLEIPGGTIFKVTGRASMLLKLAIPRTILLYIALILFAHYGLAAVAWCLVGVTALFASIALGLACKVTGARPLQMVGACWAPAVSAVVTGGVIWLATVEIPGNWPKIFVGAAVGFLTYVGMLWVTDRTTLTYLLEKTFPRFAKAV